MARLGRNFPGNRNVQYKYNAAYLPLRLTPASISFTGQTIRITLTVQLTNASVTFTGQTIQFTGTFALSPASVIFTGEQISLNQYTTPQIPALDLIEPFPRYEHTIPQLIYVGYCESPTYSDRLESPTYSRTDQLPTYQREYSLPIR